MQLTALVVVLKVEPATQDVQALFTVVEHAVETRVPAAHVLHAVQLAAFVTVLKVEPATQAVQALFVVAEHAVDAYVPAVHVVHVVHSAVPEVVVLYVPAAHVKHVEPEQYFPATQVAQAN